MNISFEPLGAFNGGTPAVPGTGLESPTRLPIWSKQTEADNVIRCTILHGAATQRQRAGIYTSLELSSTEEYLQR